MFIHKILGVPQYCSVQINVFPCSEVHVKTCPQLYKRSYCAPHRDCAECGLQNSGYCLQKGGFAASVEPYKPVHIPRHYFYAHIFERPKLFKLKSAVNQFDKIFLEAVHSLFGHIEAHTDILDFYYRFHKSSPKYTV